MAKAAKAKVVPKKAVAPRAGCRVTRPAAAGRAPTKAQESYVKSIATGILSPAAKFDKHPKLPKAAVVR